MQHGRVKGRGLAAFTQMRHEDLRRCFVAQALSWERIQVMGDIDELPAGYLYRLAELQIFVVRKEVLDLLP